MHTLIVIFIFDIGYSMPIYINMARDTIERVLSKFHYVRHMFSTKNVIIAKYFVILYTKFKLTYFLRIVGF